jgi:hypothetical protein
MKKWLSISAMMVIATLCGYLGSRIQQPSEILQAKESAFERVMRKNTLRCGYLFIRPGPIVTPTPINCPDFRST